MKFGLIWDRLWFYFEYFRGGGGGGRGGECGGEGGERGGEGGGGGGKRVGGSGRGLITRRKFREKINSTTALKIRCRAED